MKKEKEFSEITIEEQEKIKKKLQKAIENFDPKHPKLSDEINKTIRLGVNSGVKELFNIGCELAYVATLNHYKKIATKFQDPPRTEIEDLVNLVLFATIREHIQNYDGIHSLYTYFDPYVKSTFMKAREKGRGRILSKYYIDCNVTIQKARAELKNNGFTNVSSVDLSNWIRIYMDKEISSTTIERIDELDVSVESLEAKPVPLPDKTGEDPLKCLKQNVYEEKFQNTINILSNRHKDFMTAALEFTDRTGTVPTYDDAYEICCSFIPNVTKEQAIRLMRAAFSESRRHNRRYKKTAGGAPINKMRSEQDLQIMEQEEQDIEDALQNIDDFFDDF